MTWTEWETLVWVMVVGLGAAVWVWWAVEALVEEVGRWLKR